jgi:hypothetical protein
MMIQPGARHVIAIIKARTHGVGTTRPTLPDGLAVYPANGLLEDLVHIDSPSDVRSALDQLRASYDIVNQQAKGLADWDAHYADFVRFFDETRPRTEGVTAWLKVGQGTIDAIRDRARRLEEWKASLARRNVQISEPAKREPPPSSGALGGLAAAAPWVVGGLVLLSVLRR